MVMANVGIPSPASMQHSLDSTPPLHCFLSRLWNAHPLQCPFNPCMLSPGSMLLMEVRPRLLMLLEMLLRRMLLI